MHRLVVLLYALFLVVGCASSQPASDVLPGEQSSRATAKRVINAVGTPFHALFKGAACVGGTIVAVPAASVFAISGTAGDEALRRDVYDGVGRTCGGSYRLGAD